MLVFLLLFEIVLYPFAVDVFPFIFCPVTHTANSLEFFNLFLGKLLSSAAVEDLNSFVSLSFLTSYPSLSF